MITKLCQIVDTLKLHYYHVEEVNLKDHKDYITLVDTFIRMKQDAQAIHHSNNDMRYVNTRIGSDTFRVMATTFRGFSVTLRNQDISISFKTAKINTQDLNKKDMKVKTNHTHTPVIKVEFRASFLARVGHKAAITYINDLVSKYILKVYTIKVSEIHLACDIQGYNFTELDYHRFKTLKRSNTKHIDADDKQSSGIYYMGKRFTGFAFGKGDEMLRIYDKTTEITKNADKGFIKHFAWENNPNYDPDKTVWRIEIQYRRERLKTLYSGENGLLDGFENVINAIPDLWDRALQIVEHKSLTDEHCLDMIRRYSVDKDGNQHLLTNEAIKKRFQRASTSEFWNQLKSWNGYKAKETDIYKAPKTSAFQWVSNSIKSLMTTLLRYAGDLTPRILEDAFLRTDKEVMQDKDITLVDYAYANTMNYVGNNRQFQERNGVYYPSNQLLELNLSAYVHQITLNLFQDERWSDERVTYLNKALERVS